MKRTVQKTLAAILSVMLLLSCAAAAWAAPNRDSDSNFTNGPATGATADSTAGKDDTIAPDGMFYLVKDYDSANETKLDTNSTQGAPYSSSPAETFTYTITPYGVWNAGSTFSSGTATKIDTSNMPLLTGTSSPATGVTYTTSSRTFTVTQAIAIDKALKESSESNANDTRTAIYLPKYSTVGDYWYQVEETRGTNGATTGVFYGTNSFNSANDAVTNTAVQNGGHLRIYYIHVQVTESGTTAGTPTLVSNVTLHKTAPDTSWSNAQYNDSTNGEVAKYTTSANDKVNAIENRYYAGQLKVTKKVTGNAGDRNQFFKVRVTFTKPAGTVVNSDIDITEAYTLSGTTYTITPLTIKGQYDNATDWDKGANSAEESKAPVEFYVKDGTTVTFSNIPYGILYTVEEYTTDDLGYQNKFEITGDTTGTQKSFNGVSLWKDTVASGADTLGNHFYVDTDTIGTKAGAQGSITASDADVVTITNDKNVTIDIGVITDNIPFIAMLAVAGVALILLIARKRKTSEV